VRGASATSARHAAASTPFADYCRSDVHSGEHKVSTENHVTPKLQCAKKLLVRIAHTQCVDAACYCVYVARSVVDMSALSVCWTSE